MLKSLPSFNYIQPMKTKCGEIFCDGYTNFTIYCCFCNIKLFAFEDFFLHIQQVHFENKLLKAKTLTNDCIEYLKEEYEDDSNEVEVNKQEEAFECLDVSYGCDDVDNCVNVEDESFEEETLKVLHVTKGRVSKKSKTKNADKNDIGEYQYGLKDLTIDDFLPKVQHFPCPDCNNLFSRRIDLDQHVFELHKGYKCSLCDKRYRHRHHLKRHTENIHNKNIHNKNIHNAKKKEKQKEKIRTCPIAGCGRFFVCRAGLKYHLGEHSIERNFVCDFENCGKAFESQIRLKSHKYRHYGVKNYVCDTCGYSCRSIKTLQIHQRIHTGEKPYACKICQKRFYSETNLNTHMISHSSTRPYVCEICQATFTKLYTLRRHILIHSDEKTFKCKLCDKEFKQPHGLDGHMRRLHREPKSNKDKSLH